MHHTPAQKKVLQNTWIVSIAIALVFGVLYFWKEKSGTDYLFNRMKFLRVLPYAYLVLMYMAWSWDWLVNRDYKRAGAMLIAAIGIWALREYVFTYKPGNNPPGSWQHIKQQYLYSTILLFSIARALIVFERKQSVAALLAGVVLLFVLQTFYQGKFGITALTAPFLVIVEYIFRNGWLGDITRFMMGEFLQTLMFVLLAAAQIVIIQWVLQLFTNLNTDPEKEGARGIFGKSFPAVSGRYYAVMYPVLFIFTVCCFSSAVINLFYILKGGDEVDFDFPGAYGLSNFYKGDTRIMPYILVPLLSFFTVKLFQLLHTLVMGRCITMNKKFGLSYLVSFVPVLNLVPWLILSLTPTPTDEHARLEYATEMNDPNRQRSTGTVNLLITLAVLNFVFAMLSGTGGLSGFLGVMIMLTSLMMYIGFVYRPSIIYGVITIKVIVLILLISSSRINTSFSLVLSIYTVYTILMLFWQKRIFYPDIIMPVEMQLDSETELNKQVKDPGGYL